MAVRIERMDDIPLLEDKMSKSEIKTLIREGESLLKLYEPHSHNWKEIVHWLNLLQNKLTDLKEKNESI